MTKDGDKEFVTTDNGLEGGGGQGCAGEVAEDDSRSGWDGLGGGDGLPYDPAVEDFADDFELGEFGHKSEVATRLRSKNGFDRR